MGIGEGSYSFSSRALNRPGIVWFILCRVGEVRQVVKALVNMRGKRDVLWTAFCWLRSCAAVFGRAWRVS